MGESEEKDSNLRCVFVADLQSVAFAAWLPSDGTAATVLCPGPGTYGLECIMPSTYPGYQGFQKPLALTPLASIVLYYE